VAKTLQSAFLPETLPSHPKLQFDALYLTAGHEALIGGDWYDAFPLPDGRFVVSIGDVVGHGLSAAVSAGRIRQSIVATAIDTPEPDQILAKVNRLIELFDVTVATALVALVDTDMMTMRYASAGHPAPIIAGPNTKARALEYGSLPLGVAPDTTYTSHVVQLERDGYVLFYTDGVTEIQRDIESAERDLLNAVGALVTYGPAPHSADAIRKVVLGSETPTDDAVLMVMRVAPTRASSEQSDRDYHKEWSFHSSHSYSAHTARREVMQFIEQFADAQTGTFDAELILGEILANTVEHAPGLVNMEIDWSQPSPVLTVVDAGPGLERFVATLPEDDFTEDGRGLFLVKALAKEVRVESAQSYGTKMTVVLPLTRKGA
jgi:anti-sigma regulatory factor (Ser/Thr protein kinase)